MTNEPLGDPATSVSSNDLVDTLANLSVNRVGVRIPQFNGTDPELWFAMIETSFASTGITSDATKFGYVISALDSRHAQEVRDIIVNPPANAKYQKIKEELIKRLSSSQEQKTRRLLEHEEIGDRKPSQFLRPLQSLAGTAVPDAMVRTLWLGRLPTAMQGILATQKDVGLDKVAELADAIADAVPPAAVLSAAPRQSVTSVSAFDSDVVAEIRQLTLALQRQLASVQLEVHELKTQNGSNTRPRSRSRSRSRNRYRSDDGMCWYHSRYGSGARKCTRPCNYQQGNEMGGR